MNKKNRLDKISFIRSIMLELVYCILIILVIVLTPAILYIGKNLNYLKICFSIKIGFKWFKCTIFLVLQDTLLHSNTELNYFVLRYKNNIIQKIKLKHFVSLKIFLINKMIYLKYRCSIIRLLKIYSYSSELLTTTI